MNRRQLERSSRDCGLPSISCLWGYFWMAVRSKPESDLQDVSITGDHFIQDRVNEEAEKEPRNQTRDDYDRKRLLSVRADAGRKRRRQKAQTGYECGHHDGSQAQERSLARCRADVFVFETQFVDVREKDNGRLDRNAHQR